MESGEGQTACGYGLWDCTQFACFHHTLGRFTSASADRRMRICQDASERESFYALTSAPCDSRTQWAIGCSLRGDEITDKAMTENYERHHCPLHRQLFDMRIDRRRRCPSARGLCLLRQPFLGATASTCGCAGHGGYSTPPLMPTILMRRDGGVPPFVASSMCRAPCSRHFRIRGGRGMRSSWAAAEGRGWQCSADAVLRRKVRKVQQWAGGGKTRRGCRDVVSWRVVFEIGWVRLGGQSKIRRRILYAFL